MTPRAGRNTALEAILTLGIAAACVAACVRTLPALATKARLVAVFIASPVESQDAVEQFATTGSFAAIPRTTPPDAEADASTLDPAYAFVPDGAGMLASGTVGRDRQPFALSFVPAASDDGEARFVWLCGTRRAPAGWHAASAPRALRLPHGASYSICRDDAAEGA